MTVFGASELTVVSRLCLFLSWPQQCCLCIANMPGLVWRHLSAMITPFMILLGRAHPSWCVVTTSTLPVGYHVHAMLFQSWRSWQESCHPSHNIMSANTLDKLELRHLAIVWAGSWNIHQFQLIILIANQFPRHEAMDQYFMDLFGDRWIRCQHRTTTCKLVSETR